MALSIKSGVRRRFFPTRGQRCWCRWKIFDVLCAIDRRLRVAFLSIYRRSTETWPTGSFAVCDVA